MKKTLYSIITLLLLITVFVSCTQDESVFESIINSSPKSEYECLSYAGYDDTYHYIITKKQGIISFQLNEDSTVVNEVETGLKAINYACVVTGSDGKALYILCNDGKLYKNDGTLVETDKTFSKLAHGYVVTDETTPAIYKIDDFNKEIKNDANGLDIVGTFNKIVSNDYFVTSKTETSAEGTTTTYTLYSFGDSLTKIASTDKNIVNVVKSSDDTYYVITYEYNDDDSSYYYYFYKVENSALVRLQYSSSDIFLYIAAEPTASFAYKNDETNENAIYYKTKSTIDKIDLNNVTSESVTSGWAKNIYTSSTSITQFVTIDSKLYSLNGTGGLMLIDFDNNESKQIF